MVDAPFPNTYCFVMVSVGITMLTTRINLLNFVLSLVDTSYQWENKVCHPFIVIFFDAVCDEL